MPSGPALSGDNKRVTALSSGNKRVTASASVDARPTQSNRIRSRLILMESVVRIADFKEFEFEGRSLPMVFTERGWTGILKATGNVYCDIVHEFYTQLVNVPSNRTSWSVFVRGVRRTITPDKIASFLYLPRPVENTKTLRPRVDAMHQALTGRDVVHQNNVICHNDLLPFFQKLHLIVAANVNPQQHMMDLSIEQGHFLLNIARGVCIDLPNHIFQTIWRAAKSNSPKDALPFGLLITNLLLDAGVKPRSDERSYKPSGQIRFTKPSQTDVHESEYVKAAKEEGVARQTLLQTAPAARPSTQEADKGSSSQKTLPLWFDTVLLEIDSRIAEQIAPMQRQLEGIDSRLAIMKVQLRELQSLQDN